MSDVNSRLQEEASLLIENLSSSLLHMGVKESEENKKEMHNAGSTVVEGVSNIMDYSSNVSCLTLMCMLIDMFSL